jgi:hypothetical protein
MALGRALWEALSTPVDVREFVEFFKGKIKGRP